MRFRDGTFRVTVNTIAVNTRVPNVQFPNTCGEKVQSPLVNTDCLFHTQHKCPSTPPTHRQLVQPEMRGLPGVTAMGVGRTQAPGPRLQQRPWAPSPPYRPP